MTERQMKECGTMYSVSQFYVIIHHFEHDEGWLWCRHGTMYTLGIMGAEWYHEPIGDKKMPEPLEVKPLANFHLWLRYDDETIGEVDLSDLAGRDVFPNLKTGVNA